MEVAANLSLQGNVGAASLKLAQGELSKMLLMTKLKVVAVTVAVLMTVGTGSMMLPRNGVGDESQEKQEESSLPEEHQKLVGEWQAVSGDFAGNAGTPGFKQLNNLKMTFTPERLIVTSENTKQSGHYKLDFSHKPYQLDLFKDSSSSREQNRKVNRAIFEVKGDQLKICLNESTDGERPQKFASVPGTVIGYTVLKRVKSGQLSEAEVQKQLEGEWQSVLIERGGQEIPARHFSLNFIFAKNKVTSISNVLEGQEESDAQYKLDLSHETGWIDFISRNQAGKIENKPCIFELKGDILKVCLPNSRTERPTELGSAKGSTSVFVVFERLKPE